jgi:hypothetical protein
VDASYPYCEGQGEYWECEKSAARSEVLLESMERVLEVLATNAFEDFTADELADRLQTVIAESLVLPLDAW